ncbi:DUF2076 domain-containing protein [Photobacterium phosphoreum]|uniref:DUF2076 domain-containing protein n=1 Tax=Photobacterium phosphoreum TaxID=659 RepID=UPI0005D2EFC2|nr:DUF2076 family protein [Photobacterium phosphoreum]KJF86507.1 ABC transporter substrate-binding protein [Photobacterium phosphoreum]PQJ86165.1 ABC transporter substrate-binding protein [Photobacterium phosphoreum]PSV68891.1 DUF2076 domain-containing protein [Photobacterium phosphoreum]
MTPQEKELIQSVAAKLQKSPESKKDADAEQLINTEIGAQPDAIYKLTQAVLVQEMALKQLKEKNDYLEKNAEYYKEESNRGPMSRMFGGSRQAPPQQPQPPAHQPSAFGGFMQTAAGVAAGMVAGSVISNMIFGDKPAEIAAADPAADAAPAADATDAATDTTDTAQADTAADATTDPQADNESFLNDDSNSFASDYTGGFGDAGFGDDNGGFGDSGFGGDDSGFGGDDTFANNSGFGDTDGGFGGDFGGDDEDF